MNNPDFTCITFVFVQFHSTYEKPSYCGEIGRLWQDHTESLEGISYQVLTITDWADFIEGCPVVDFWEFFKTEGSIIYKVFDVFTVQEVSIW